MAGEDPLGFALINCCLNLGLNNIRSKAVSLYVVFQIKGIICFPTIVCDSAANSSQ